MKFSKTPGPRNLITDVTGLLVGNAQDTDLKSGVTVLICNQHTMTASCGVLGGAPGTRETDLLQPEKSVSRIDAIVLSGGSAYGLDACSGVTAGLHKMGRGYTIGSTSVPIVPGAILFDLLNGGHKNWNINPYSKLGRQALKTASTHFELGSMGAGAGALTATLKGGLGSASLVLDEAMTVGALAAVNSVGTVTTPGERHFWAAPFEIGDEFGGLGPDPRTELGYNFTTKKVHSENERCNTTIAVVATDASMSKAQAKHVATVAHAGIARAILPSHMPSDGDIVFCVSTHPSQASASNDSLHAIVHGTTLCLSRAIARAIYCAQPHPTDLLPTWNIQNPKEFKHP